MALDEALAKRIRKTLTRKMGITDKKTSGGIVFSLNGNMLGGRVEELLDRAPR